jgi:hypothetical protein
MEPSTCHGGGAEDAPEEVGAEDDLEGGAPQHVDVDYQVHEPLRVDRHQVRCLRNFEAKR